MITIDATNKKIGRVATEVARALMGKNSPTWTPNVTPVAKVTIINTSKADVGVKKMGEKAYRHYTGFPGGLKELSMEKVVAKKGYSEIFRKAVRGMLPKNKLQAIMMKNLTVNE